MAEVLERTSRRAAELISRDRVQAIVDRYRNGRYIEGIFSPDGEPILVPPILVPEGYGKSMETDIVAVIEDCCAVSDKEATELLKRNGGIVTKDFYVVLSPPMGRLRLVRDDTVRRR